jgi:beta-N-acetylglucosaminidase
MGAEPRRASGPAPPRVAVFAALMTAALLCSALPVAADSGSGADAASEASAQQALNQAEIYATQADAAAQLAQAQLAAARSALSAAKAELTALRARVAALDARVTADQAAVDRLNREIQANKAELAALVRASYESGGDAAGIAYMVDAQTIGDFMERLNEVGHAAESGTLLVQEIQSEEGQAQRTLAAAVTARQQARAAQAQAATQEAIIANDEVSAAQAAEQASVTAQRAHLAVATAQSNLSAIQQAIAAAAAAQARARASGTVYPPVPGPIFTVDTDLTLPSGENAATLDAFLAGTALAGLGQSYMNAETTYGVSALYLTAHSIEESGWGTSALAQVKHNLFGFGADDSNPFGDAMSFPSFDACIQYVAHYVKQNYLTPGGLYYHGPTLRGMNVDYASDPLWASKIAAIADTIPLPGS